MIPGHWLFPPTVVRARTVEESNVTSPESDFLPGGLMSTVK